MIKVIYQMFDNSIACYISIFLCLFIFYFYSCLFACTFSSTLTVNKDVHIKQSTCGNAKQYGYG